MSDTPPTRPRRTFVPVVLWTAAILAALGLAWLGSAVVWPFFRSRAVVRQCVNRRIDLRSALQELGGPERARPWLLALLRSSDRVVGSDERACSAYLLGYCGDGALPALRAATRDRSDAVRLCAIEAISCGEFAMPVTDDVLAGLNDPCEYVRVRAVLGLWSSCCRMRRRQPGPQVAVSELPGKEEYFPYGGDVLWHYDEFHGSALIFMEPSLATWDRFSYREDPPAQSSAGAEVRRLVPILAGLLADSNTEVRRAAATALEIVGPDADEAVPALIRALDGKGESERQCYLLALFDLRGVSRDAAVRVLRATGDSDVGVRAMALRRASLLPLQAGEVIPILEKALQDENQDNLSLAAEALKNIRGKEPPK